MSNVVLRDANELPGPRGFQIGVTLDALQTFLKSGGLRGHLNPNGPELPETLKVLGEDQMARTFLTDPV